MLSTDVLILGGGLAGLSTAYHLDRLGGGKTRWLIAEKRDKLGGRAATEEKDGFLHDHTGHLLHLHDPYGKKLITGLLRGNLASHERSTWIYSHKVFTRYPFQANTYGLPPKVIAECVAEFILAQRGPRPKPDASFAEWVRKTFGRGIEKHFMAPYNRKLWRIPLDRMTTEWQGRFLPNPTPEEVIYGALTDQKKFFGYNAYFRYPIRGGTQALPDALAQKLDPKAIALNAKASQIDLRERIAVIEGVGEVRYGRLVNTMPLAEFLDIAAPLPKTVRAARARLRWVSVHNLNIGVDRAKLSDKHWIYFPEKSAPYYRVGFTSNFSRLAAPKGSSSMYIEISADPGARPDLKALERSSLSALRACGILRASDRVISKLWIPIECAYVVYDRARTPSVAAILENLASVGVSSIGRWGGWKYSFMEETILDGKRCAESLLGIKSGVLESRGPLTALK